MARYRDTSAASPRDRRISTARSSIRGQSWASWCMWSSRRGPRSTPLSVASSRTHKLGLSPGTTDTRRFNFLSRNVVSFER